MFQTHTQSTSSLQVQALQHPGFMIRLPGRGAVCCHHFEVAPVISSGGMKWQIINLGTKLRAKLRAWCERASVTIFFLPSMWKMRRLMSCWIQILVAVIKMGLYKLRVQRELKML